MRRMIRCEDCGKMYNYDEDAFCPNCGAFNQPGKASLVKSAKAVERVDGINEAGHADSFVHEELHRENRQRRNTPLEEPVKRRLERSSITTKKMENEKKRRQAQRKRGTMLIAFWFIVFFMIFIALLNSCRFNISI